LPRRFFDKSLKYSTGRPRKGVGTTRVDMPDRKKKWAAEMPFGELHALYSHIFSSVEDIETVFRVP
jgi:hypothetical protein